MNVWIIERRVLHDYWEIVHVHKTMYTADAHAEAIRAKENLSSDDLIVVPYALED